MRDHEPVPPPVDGLNPVSYLGSGGFGEVFLYEDVDTSARYAVKVLRDGSLTAGGTALMQEAHALGRLSANGPHPNIVAVQRVGLTQGRPFLVMEYCPGGSWAQQIGLKGRIHPARVLSVGIQIAGALHMAHGQGIVHRDIKPGNILFGARIGGEGTPKLADFGIAAITAAEAARASGWMSYDYCAPEVLESGEADELSDIFALGATLYHALAGRSWVRDPHGDNSTEAIEHRIRTAAVPPAGAHAPETLEWLLRAAMNRDRSVRAVTFPSAKEFALRLQEIELEWRYPATPLPIEEADEPTGLRRGDDTAPRPNAPPPPESGESEDDDALAKTRKRDAAQPRDTARRWSRVRVRHKVWIAATVAAVAAGVVLANAFWGFSPQPDGADHSVRPGETAYVLKPPVPMPIVDAEWIDGDSVRYAWTYPDPQEGDKFKVKPDGLTVIEPPSPEWIWHGVGPGACVEVWVVRADMRTSPEGTRKCAPSIQ